jgi:hypothetical protein
MKSQTNIYIFISIFCIFIFIIFYYFQSQNKNIEYILQNYLFIEDDVKYKNQQINKIFENIKTS